LTAAPARFLAIDNRVGTLAVGRDADLVVLSGSPFELSTRVLAVMIDGQWVYQEEDDR
jgi:imidazolonepropionase-like amidohydrolase